MRYVADTNVASELTKAEPRLNVVNWLLKHESEIYLTSITIEEFWYGLERMPEGVRKMRLMSTLESIASHFENRILSFDDNCGRVCGNLHAKEVLSGYAPTIEDVMIASIAITHDAVLVTRNVKDFNRFPLDIVNPFS